MHRALEIQEILYNVFHQCTRKKESLCGPAKYEVDSALLAALARTCHAFKEPALDVLWMTLRDLPCLVRCLPEACHPRHYGLSRPLTQAEWDILRSYARRIRSMDDWRCSLEAESYRLLSNPPFDGPLFPNLRDLHCRYSKTTMPFLNLPLPSLVSLDILVEIDSSSFLSSSDAFPAFSPNIRKVAVLFEGSGAIGSSYICRWRNLHSLNCFRNCVDVDALVHLSRMHTFTQLRCALPPTLPEFDPPLSFSNLQHLSLRSTSLNPIVQLLSQTRLPALMDFGAIISDGPSGLVLSSLLNSFHACKVDFTLEKLQLSQRYPRALDRVRSEAILLNLEYLRPCMTLRNLREITINIKCNVYLTDSELLTLASSWPKLEVFKINMSFGWNSQCGITPGGLVRLLQICQLLKDISLRLNTEYYANVSLSHARVLHGLAWTRELRIDVLDAALKKESMLAITAFFSIIAACCGASHRLQVIAWCGSRMIKLPIAQECERHWRQVIDSLPT